MCYYYDGDGVCEDFERETGVRDCGLYTPSGYLDQWASSVDVSHEEKPYCSGEVAAGYPAVTKVSSYIACSVRTAAVLKERKGMKNNIHSLSFHVSGRYLLKQRSVR